MRMSKRGKKGLVPALRFPDFQGADEWEEKLLSILIEEFRENSTVQDEFEVLTSARSGLVRQREYYDNDRIAERDNIGFNIIPPNYLTYRSRSDDRRFYINENTLGITGIISTYYPVFRVANGSNKFFVEMLSRYQIVIGKHSVGTSQTVLSLNELRRIRLPIPTAPEQQKIADCLVSIDDFITTQTQKIDVLKAHKKGLMQQLFPAEGEAVPRLRFPEFRRKGEWKKHTIHDFAKVTTGSKDTQNKVDDGKYLFFVRSQTVERIGTYSYDGEAILTSGDGVGVGKNFHYINGKFDFHQRVYCIYGFSNYAHGKFVFQYFSEHFSKRAMQLTAKNSVDSVRMAMITEMPIRLPDLKEQQKIADCLTSIDELITAQTQKIEALKTHKKGLMQQLFPSINEQTDLTHG